MGASPLFEGWLPFQLTLVHVYPPLSGWDPYWMGASPLFGGWLPFQLALVHVYPPLWGWDPYWMGASPLFEGWLPFQLALVHVYPPLLGWDPCRSPERASRSRLRETLLAWGLSPRSLRQTLDAGLWARESVSDSIDKWGRSGLLAVKNAPILPLNSHHDALSPEALDE